MKRIALFFALFIPVLIYGQSTQVDTKKLIARQWIIYQGDTLNIVRTSGDSIFFERGATIDTMIVSSYWTKAGDNIANNNAGKVTIDSLYLYPMPPLAVKVGRIPVLQTDGQVEWTYPLSLYEKMLDSISDSPSDVATNTGALVYWKYDWSKAMLDNSNTATIDNANILVIGDSYTPNYGYPLKEIGGHKYGHGGGYEIPQQITYPTWGFLCHMSNWSDTYSQSDPDNWTERYAWTVTNGATIKISSVNFNKIRIHYKTKPGYGKFSVQLNAGTPDTVNCNAAEGAGWYTWNKAGSNVYTYYSDTVYVRAIGTDTLKIFGYSLEMNPTTYSNDNKKGYLGVHILQNGGSSTRSRYLNKDTAEIHQLLDTLDASLCIITYLDDASQSPIVSMDSLIGLLNLLRPEMDVIVVCPNDESNGYGRAQSDSLAIIARSRGVAFMNGLAIGNYTDLAASGAITDGIHLSSIGKYMTFNEFEPKLFTDKRHNGELTAWKLTNRGDYLIFPRSQNIAIVSRDVGVMTPTLNNTLLGYRSAAFVRQTGQQNTYIGAFTGETNTTGSYNTAVGTYSMDAITEGLYNTAVGVLAATGITTDQKNVAIGYQALQATAGGGNQNVAVGYQALYSNITGDGNTTIGESAGRGITGGNNTIAGYQAGYTASTGSNNSAFGSQSLQALTSGTYNSVLGNQAGYSLSSGHYNTAIGSGAMYGSTGASSNTIIGMNAGYDMVSSLYNVMVGNSAGENTTGSYNTLLGYRAGFTMSSGEANVFLGYNAGYNETASNKLYIENSNSATPLIWGDFSADSLRLNADVVIGKDITYEDTYWRDAVVSSTQLANGVNAPTLTAMVGTTIYMPGFNYQTANDEMYGNAQINHDYKLGTDIEAHCHWSINTSPAVGVDTVVIEFEYAWADIGENVPTSTTVTKKIATNAIGGDKHSLTELVTTITGDGGDGLSSIIWFRIERLQDNASDTYAGWWLLHDIDFHYQVDSPGSRAELSK